MNGVNFSGSGFPGTGQLFHSFDKGILPVILGQGQAFEAFDAPGHGIEDHLVPAVGDGLFPFLEPPFLYHAGTKATKMLDVHGIHGAAV